MSVADDLTYNIPTPSDVHCNRCDVLNVNVDIWDDIRTGRWEYEFTCTACGVHNQEDGNALDRGSAQALFLLRACAVFLMILGALGQSWFWFSIGLCTLAAPLIIRAAHAADARKGQRNV